MITSVTLTLSFEWDPTKPQKSDLVDRLFDLKVNLMDQKVDFVETWFQDGQICEHTVLDWFEETIGDWSFTGTPHQNAVVKQIHAREVQS